MKFLFLIISTILVGGQSYPKEIQTVEIAPNAHFPLIAPEKFKAFSALQKVTVYWEDKKLCFNVQLENSEGAFHLVGLTPVYSRSFLISYSKGLIDFKEHPYFRYPVRPENMLADFQMAFAEVQYLTNKNPVLKVNSNTREFWSGKELIQTIKYSNEDKWQSEVNITNHRNNYRLNIKTLQFEYL